MTLPNINFKSGKIIFDDFFIDPTISYENQTNNLSEGLLYIKFDEYSEVDVSWIPNWDPNGRFVVLVLKNGDWDNPIYRKETRNFLKLEQYLQEGIDLAENLTTDKNVSNLRASSNSTNFEYSNFKFDRASFKQFFSEEHVYDQESGPFYYYVQLEDDFELTLNLLASDNFIRLKLARKTNQIFSIGFEGITSIKLIQKDDYWFLDVHKNHLGTDEDDSTPYLSIIIKPHFHIKTLVKN